MGRPKQVIDFSCFGPQTRQLSGLSGPKWLHRSIFSFLILHLPLWFSEFFNYFFISLRIYIFWFTILPGFVICLSSVRKFLKTQEKIKTSVIRSFYFIALITLAGVPATTIFSGTSLVTTAPAKADILSAVCIKRREQADGLIHFLSRKLRQDFPYFLRSVVRIV